MMAGLSLWALIAATSPCNGSLRHELQSRLEQWDPSAVWSLRCVGEGRLRIDRKTSRAQGAREIELEGISEELRLTASFLAARALMVDRPTAAPTPPALPRTRLGSKAPANAPSTPQPTAK